MDPAIALDRTPREKHHPTESGFVPALDAAFAGMTE